MFKRGGIDRAAAGNRPQASVCAHLVTLRRFDDKTMGRSKSGPFIPWERRLADMRILEIQGRAFGAGF